MTRAVRRIDIPLVAVDLRHTGELLLHKCQCGNAGCTIGEHLYRSTRDMAPGPRAANQDPDGKGWRYEQEGDTVWPVPSGDITGEAATRDFDDTSGLHAEYQTLLDDLHAADRALQAFVQRHRPDRTLPKLEAVSDSEWCRVCLQTIGKCSPRYRSDLCRDCYDFHGIYKFDRPAELVRAKHEGQRITQQMVEAAVRAERKRKQQQGRKRKKAG